MMKKGEIYSPQGHNEASVC